MSELLKRRAYFGKNCDDYNFPIEIMNDSSDLVAMIEEARKTDDIVEKGASIVFTEKQSIVAFNRNGGEGAHNSALARIYADMTDGKELGFMNVMKYFHALEARFLHGRIYVEKDSRVSKLRNILSFSFYRGDNITPGEYAAFKMFYDEYAWLIKRENFDVSFKGRTISLDNLKTLLESMIDPDLDISHLFSTQEKIIGQTVETENDKKSLC